MGVPIRRNKMFPLDQVVLAAFRMETDQLLWEKPITPELTEDALYPEQFNPNFRMAEPTV